jgi:hypothetical protein
VIMNLVNRRYLRYISIVVDQHVLSVYVVIIHVRVHDPLCRMDNGIYCLSFELALKLYERKTTKL